MMPTEAEIKEVFQGLTWTQIGATFITVVAIFILRHLVISWIKHRKNISINRRRKWTVNANSAFSFLLIISIILIWSSELQTMAFSFVAIAAALAIATKEVLACFTGGLYKSSNNLFDVGDRIEVGGIRGDVIDRNLFATTLLEIGPGSRTHQYTGRSVSIPNSFFLTHPVINESFLKNFVLHTFSIPLAIKCDWRKAEELLLRISEEVCSHLYPTVEGHMKRFEQRAAIQPPRYHPRVHLKFIDYKSFELIVRVTVPANEKGQYEQEIIKRFMTEYSDELKNCVLA